MEIEFYAHVKQEASVAGRVIGAKFVLDASAFKADVDATISNLFKEGNS